MFEHSVINKHLDPVLALPDYMSWFQVNLPSWVNFPDFERVGWLNSVLGVVPLTP